MPARGRHAQRRRYYCRRQRGHAISIWAGAMRRFKEIHIFAGIYRGLAGLIRITLIASSSGAIDAGENAASRLMMLALISRFFLLSIYEWICWWHWVGALFDGIAWHSPSASHTMLHAGRDSPITGWNVTEDARPRWAMLHMITATMSFHDITIPCRFRMPAAGAMPFFDF